MGVCKITLVFQSQTRVAKDMDRAQLLYVMPCTFQMLIIYCNDEHDDSFAIAAKATFSSFRGENPFFCTILTFRIVIQGETNPL